MIDASILTDLRCQTCFAVATLSEAMELRSRFKDAEFLVMGHTPDYLLAAAWGTTNRNEILCGIGRRVSLLYLRGGKPVAMDDRLWGSTLRFL
ncbi:MAG: hypothetical protein NT061_09405 [Spirochaetes bacterium]|nr:hypothetical protein [Spirochaetota bacterium]